ncbi:MAG TPA: hypothetical protein VHC43_15670 [Mycobacteriales bacterium]|nr:hypothetical protein [Mycobacteriales bacterium]
MGVIALIVALAFTTTIAVREWRRADRTQSQFADELTQRHNAGVDADALAVALYTFDYRDLGAAQKRIQMLATGGFAEREASQSAAVQTQLRNAKAVGTAAVEETNVSEIDGDHATAFVVLQTTASSNGGKKVANVVYLHLDLRRIGALWKVDDVQNLAAQSS